MLGATIRLVRWLLLACVVVAVAGAARAFAEPPLRPPEIDDGRKLCDRGKTWAQIIACFSKRGSANVIHESDGQKIVAYKMPHWGEHEMELHLYVPTPKGWRRFGFLSGVRPDEELLSIARFTSPAGDGIRIDVGQVTSTSISLDRMSSVRGILRRTQSHLCTTASWACRILTTSCEAYVHGKLAFAFRAEIAWHRSFGARLKGDVSRAGGPCAVSKTMMIDGIPEI
jgi:hypothetical protein